MKEMEEKLKEAFEEGYKKAAGEAEEKMKSAFDEGYAKAKDDVVDKLFETQGEFRAEQHAESYRLGYCKCLDDSRAGAEDERRTLIEVPPLASVGPNVDASSEREPAKDPQPTPTSTSSPEE